MHQSSRHGGGWKLPNLRQSPLRALHESLQPAALRTVPFVAQRICGAQALCRSRRNGNHFYRRGCLCGLQRADEQRLRHSHRPDAGRDLLGLAIPEPHSHAACADFRRGVRNVPRHQAFSFHYGGIYRRPLADIQAHQGN